jgi:hypothetical protein
MFKHSRWIFAGLLILSLSLVSCKLISVEQQAVNVMATIEETVNVHPPNDPSNHKTINIADYWPEGFDGWNIETATLNALEFKVISVTSGSNESANFEVRFTNLTPPPTVTNQLLGNTTSPFTLNEVINNPMNVWNNKVEIDSLGETILMKALSDKETIDLNGTTIGATGEAQFSVIVTVKVQLTMKKD